MFFLKKTKAGALQYVLVISVIIALVVFAFISLIYLQRKLQIKNSLYKEAIQNVQLGFNYLDKINLSYNTPEERQFSENKLEKTILKKKHWGVFDIVTISSSVKNEYFQKIGLVGSQNNQRDALYLKENNTPLVLVGKTIIKGNVKLPKQGVKSGNISGTSFYGNKLINGNIKTSSTALPILKNITHIKELYNRNYTNDNITYFELDTGLNHTQLFSQPTKIYQTDDTVFLSDIKLQGNIVIQSKKTITVASSAKLNDIILIAPTIKILKNVIGNFQAFASKNIVVEKNCNLKYPSSLVLFNKEKIKKENNITFKGSTIKGPIVYYNDSYKENTSFDSQVFISKESTIVGEVYCTKNIELLGKVYGSVYASNFITKQFGSVYINHIYNGVINTLKLPSEYCGLPINTTSKKVAKWLY